jgi:flagellar hook-length control protein FliK
MRAVPADVLTWTISPQVAAAVLPTPSGDSKTIPAPSADLPKQNATNGIAAIVIPAVQGLKMPSVVSASPSKPTADTRLPAREGAHSTGTIETKTAPTSGLPEPRKAAADVAPISAVSAPPLPAGDIKTQVPQKSLINDTVAPKPEVAGAQPTSETSRKNGDTEGNAGSPSGNGDSSKPVSASVAKPSASDAITQTSGPSAPNGVNSTQVSPTTEGKAVTSTVFSKSNEPASKGLGQLPTAVTDAEATADSAASHIMSSLQTAKLVERAGQTELRVGIPAGEFGSVDIRTSMGRNQFTAEISVERAELGRALTAELPALHNRLAEQRVPPANIILQERSSGNSSSDLRQGARHNPYSQTMNVPGVGDTDAMSMIALEAMEDSRGLDIHI